MALNIVRTLRGLERRVAGWQRIEICDAPDPRSTDALWRQIAAAGDCPTGCVVYFRRGGESAAEFKAKLPAVTELAPLPANKIATLTHEERLERVLLRESEGVARLGTLQTGVTTLLERISEIAESVPALRGELAEAKAAAAADLATVETIRVARRYVDILLGGLAVKLNLLPANAIETVHGALKLYDACLEAGWTPDEGAELLRATPARGEE